MGHFQLCSPVLEFGLSRLPFLLSQLFIWPIACLWYTILSSNLICHQVWTPSTSCPSLPHRNSSPSIPSLPLCLHGQRINALSLVQCQHLQCCPWSHLFSFKTMINQIQYLLFYHQPTLLSWLLSLGLNKCLNLCTLKKQNKHSRRKSPWAHMSSVSSPSLILLCVVKLLIKVMARFSTHWLDLFHSAAAKSPQSCPTLCDPIDGSPPGSAVPGILQARTLEWVAISFSFSLYILSNCFSL